MTHLLWPYFRYKNYEKGRVCQNDIWLRKEVYVSLLAWDNQGVLIESSSISSFTSEGTNKKHNKI